MAFTLSLQWNIQSPNENMDNYVRKNGYLKCQLMDLEGVVLDILFTLSCVNANTVVIRAFPPPT